MEMWWKLKKHAVSISQVNSVRWTDVQVPSAGETYQHTFPIFTGGVANRENVTPPPLYTRRGSFVVLVPCRSISIGKFCHRIARSINLDFMLNHCSNDECCCGDDDSAADRWKGEFITSILDWILDYVVIRIMGGRGRLGSLKSD